MPAMLPTTKDLIRRFQAAGWSIDQKSADTTEGATIWCVTAHRGRRVVRAEAPLENIAWFEAARLAKLDDQNG